MQQQQQQGTVFGGSEFSQGDYAGTCPADASNMAAAMLLYQQQQQQQ
jgi:hypothetical protein